MDKTQALERAKEALEYSILEYQGSAFEDTVEAELDRDALRVIKKMLEASR